MFLPYLKFVAAFFANACASLFVADAGRLVTFGAHQLYLGSVQRGLNINQAAGLAHLAGLYMLGNHIDLLDDDFTLSRANSNNFAAHALGDAVRAEEQQHANQALEYADDRGKRNQAALNAAVIM